MKVLLAINHPQLVDQFYRESNLEITPASDVSYLEAVKEAVVSDKPEVLVMSAYLYGSEKQGEQYLNTIFAARENGVRVIFLAGSMEKDDPILSEIARLGVYDIVFNPCFLEKIMRHIKNPADFKEVSFYLNNRAHGKRDPVKPLTPSLFLKKPGAAGTGGNRESKGLIPRLMERITSRPAKAEVSSGEVHSPVEPDPGDRDRGKKNPGDPICGTGAGPQDPDKMPCPAGDGEPLSSNGEEGSDTVKGCDQKAAVIAGGEKRTLKERGRYYQPSLLEERINECFSEAASVGDDSSACSSRLKTTGRSLVVACWSPASTGKTFVAVNLAAVASEKENGAALVDLDFGGRAVYGWLNITDQPESVFKLVSGEPGECAYSSGLEVYGAGPTFNVGAADSLPEPDMGELLNRINNRTFVVLDMPRELSSWHWKLMKQCSSVVVVADPDCNNFLKLARYSGDLAGCILVANKHVALEGPLDYSSLFGVKPSVTIPLLSRVYNSILTGKPLVLTDREIFSLFDRLHQKIRQSGKCVEMAVSAGQEA